MRIVPREEFLRLPKGMIFSWWEPCIFRGLAIKYDTTSGGNAFFYRDLIGNVAGNSSADSNNSCEKAAKYGLSLTLDFHCIELDSTFDDNQWYAVYETRDVCGLICAIVQRGEDD